MVGSIRRNSSPLNPITPRNQSRPTLGLSSKAVEEATDEASRRGALAVTCNCWNQLNLRNTDVLGFYAVDVTGYEPCGIYSWPQIEKARNSFVPSCLLSFVRKLAQNPMRCVDQHRLDIETQHGITFGTIPQQQQNVHHHVSKDEAPDSRQTLPGDYVLQKRSPPTVQQESIKNERDDAVQEPMPLLALTEGDDTIGAAGAHASLETLDESKPQDVKAVIALDDGAFAGAVSEPDLFSPAKVQALASVDVPGPETGSMNFISPPTTAQESKSAEGVKVLKAPKRKREDGIPSGQIKKKKTKKKDSGIAVLVLVLSGGRRNPQKSLVLPQASESVTPEFRHPNWLRRGHCQNQAMRTLRLSLLRILGEQREPALPSSVKPTKPRLRPEDPRKSGRKRGPSSGQEEIAVKRVKKLTQVKTLTTEKKSVLGQKPPERIRQEQETPTPVAPLVRAASKPPIARKEETLNHPKVVSPTYLVMKFPPKSTLPSVASMKAKFARFGTLEIDAIRVYWKSLTCKVLFKYRVDAVAAYSHCKSNQTYGPRVNYSIRDADSSVSETPDSAKRQETKAADGTQFGTGNGNATAGMSLNPLRPSLRPQTGQPKSILKKPDDVGGGSGRPSKGDPTCQVHVGW
ncbi:hypothetical protein J5N97_018178 [Dioscorea zingiberensis]|uniref:Uncharacterized protein n=1 Tax=Dioscorea zingiberensis TaxID=325984 RepID=A0A9D5CME1_9LILI|nr:hypothetical protein J5N97_018178 [Dioscorea zingiberensis]